MVFSKIAPGVIIPAELELLGRVFDATTPPVETPGAREGRAKLILMHFQGGCTDEAELIRSVTGGRTANPDRVARR